MITDRTFVAALDTIRPRATTSTNPREGQGMTTYFAACARCEETHDTTGPQPPEPALFDSAEEAIRDAVAKGAFTKYHGQLLCWTCVELAQADQLAEHGVYHDNRRKVARLPKHVLTGIFGPDQAQIITSRRWWRRSRTIGRMVFLQRGPA